VKALIVDDERLARRELRRLLAAHPEVDIVGEASGVGEAIEKIEALAPELIFLDIHMPRRSGFAVLESVEEAPDVVFTTAHDEHALEAFEAGAVDYLLKPISPARLAKALDRIKARRSVGARGRAYADPDRPLFLRDGDVGHFVRLRDITLFESAGNYVQVRFGTHAPLLLRSLAQLQRRLDPAIFFRASRSHILNLGHVDHVERDLGGTVVAHMRGGYAVPLSRRRAVALRRRLSL
jgi:two-component system LytT family response regulator